MEQFQDRINTEKRVDFSNQTRFAIMLEARIRCGLSRVGKPEFLGCLDGETEFLHLLNNVKKGEHP